PWPPGPPRRPGPRCATRWSGVSGDCRWPAGTRSSPSGWPASRWPPPCDRETPVPRNPDARIPLPRPGVGAMKARLGELLRVDHAGELAAVQIYRGQRAVFDGAPGRETIAADLAEMEAQEAEHLKRFDDILTQRRVRPTLLAPVWRAAGYALGAGTALLGEKAAHACTEAVE